MIEVLLVLTYVFLNLISILLLQLFLMKYINCLISLVLRSRCLVGNAFKSFLALHYQFNWNQLLVQHSYFSCIWVFFHVYSQFTGQQGKVEAIYLTSLYHFHPLHRHLDINRAIIAKSSPLHIANSLTRTGKFCWIFSVFLLYFFRVEYDLLIFIWISWRIWTCLDFSINWNQFQ